VSYAIWLERSERPVIVSNVDQGGGGGGGGGARCGRTWRQGCVAPSWLNLSLAQKRKQSLRADWSSL
jgi:hypothetical protein